MGNILQSAENDFISGIRVLLVEARQSVVKQVNATMIKTYYEIGLRIVEQEQSSKGKRLQITVTTSSYGCRSLCPAALAKASPSAILNL